MSDGIQPRRGQVPHLSRPPASFTPQAELVLDVPVDYGLLTENLTDVATAPFSHTSAFASSWPLTNVVHPEARGPLAAGDASGQNVEIVFQPPCVVLSTVSLSESNDLDHGLRPEEAKRQLHQVHVCLPSKPGFTRLLVRLSLNFAPLAAQLPGLDRLWSTAAGRALQRDLALVVAQQAGMQRRANPVLDGQVTRAPYCRISHDGSEGVDSVAAVAEDAAGAWDMGKAEASASIDDGDAN